MDVGAREGLSASAVLRQGARRVDFAREGRVFQVLK